jgi:hypothetical protein
MLPFETEVALWACSGGKAIVRIRAIKQIIRNLSIVSSNKATMQFLLSHICFCNRFAD